MANTPPIPAGWEIEGSGSSAPKLPPIPAGFVPTGEVVDGDTIRLDGAPNARLSGFDAWESDQLGYRPGRGPLNIGELSTNALDGFVTPQTSVSGIGKQTFGRPVVTLDNGGNDPIVPMLWEGQGYAAPEYLSADPDRAASYMEAERLGRLNRQGGFGTNHIRPDAYRRPLTTRTAKLAADEYLAFDDQLPDDAPKLKRLDATQEKRIAAYVASQAGNPNFSLQQYRDWFRNELGVTDFEPVDDPKFIESVRKGEGFSPAIDYSNLDAQSMRELQELIALSGLRPEDARGYRDLLASGDQAQVLEYARSKGMTLDPRDVSEYFDARAKGGNAPIPLPIIDPGDGRTGAAARGFGDPLGFLDEMGAVPDTLGLTGYRENVWNSDRSFGDIYENNLRQNRAIIDNDETKHPYYRLAGQFLSGSVIPIGAGARTIGGFAKAGATEGAIYGFGSADGNLGDRLLNVPVNSALGAVGGATVGTAIKGIGELSKRFSQFIKRPSGAPVDEVADARRVVAFEDALSREVAPDATEITQDQVARAFQAADEAAGAPVTSADDVPEIPPGFQIERADMAAEDIAPSIASERVPDMIDVGDGRTSPLADGPSPDLMRAATARVEPADVLPRASDEVSADEAARLAEGPYQPVPAPRERDYLDARQFPSRANPDNTITRRGPLDLVSYARAQGGMIDEGGELTAAGISNAARKGEDFAGGENRLGRLVDNESGATIEDMAQRAWSEGYFPELDAPPTIQEFVAALDDTYRGVGRRFRPQDQGEILAYEGARDQRLAVERARQDGAPLVDDLGRPATLDDMVANTPPPVDPDEWSPATLAKVGNVRVDKLDTPQEISRALKVGHDITGGFASARRGVITQAETEALASDLGMTADQLLARRKGQALNAEEALAARRILAASGNELVNMARRIERAGDDPGSEMLASFRKALVRHTAIQEQVSGATAEAGRTLAQFRMTANSREIPGRVLEGLVNGGGGSQRLKEAAEAIIDLERDPANLNRFVEKAAKPRWKDKVVELWYNFLLSGPQTHAVNVLSNTMTSLAQIPEHGAAWGIGAARNAFNRRAADRVLLSEVGARATGLLQGTKEGLREFGRAFRTGEPSDFVSKVESQSQKAISGIKGEVLRLPTRLLTAEDELFKAIARRQALAGLSVRQASREGLKGADAKARAAQLLANPSDGMLHEAMDYARYVTFQKPLGPVGSKISAVTNDMPILKAVLPFIRTPTNLVKFAVERSPAAPMLREWRKDFGAGGARRDLAVARATVGTGIAAVVAELAARGVITGSAPSDDNKRRLMLADGWQPYSLKIGDKYYSYRRLDPFAMTFGTAADIATLGEGMSEKSREEGVGLVVASIISNLTNKTWLSGMTDALEALRDPERYSGNFIERLAGSATVPTGVAQVARTIDPTMRETPDVASAIQSRVPGLTDDLLPKRDIWGEPITQEDAPGPNIISPLWVSTGKNDPITREILRVGGTVSPPQKGDLTPEQYNELQAVRGSLAKRWLGDLFASEGYSGLPADDQVEEIRKTVSAATKAAKANVLASEPLPSAKPEKGKRRVSAKAPADLPPLPPGFELAR